MLGWETVWEYRLLQTLGFPGDTVLKNLPEIQDARDMDSIPASGRALGIGNGDPLQHSCLENSMDRGAHGVAKSQTQSSTHAHVHVHTHTHTHTHAQHKLPVNAFTEEVMVLSESPNIFLSRTVLEKSSQSKEGGIAKSC